MINEKKIGVGLSGGGYRAAAYHIGTLRKLKELNILDKVDILSTISGGSITGAVYCLHQGDFASFEKKMIATVTQKSVVKYVLCTWLFWRCILLILALIAVSVYMRYTPFAGYSILPIALLMFLLIRFQFKILPLSRIIEKAYNKFFCLEATLSGLNPTPELAIGSTNLQSMRHFTFSRRKMEDSWYAYLPEPIRFKNEKFPVARAVMASSCVPFAFSPVTIDKEFYADQKFYGKIDPKLVDGGVYDNQGVHKLTQPGSSYACDIVLISDAGNKLPFEKAYNNTFTLLMRTVDTFMVRIKNFQMMQNIYYKSSSRQTIYQSISWDLENCIPGFFDALKNKKISARVIEAHQIPAEWAAKPDDFKENIIKLLAENCLFDGIYKRNPKEKELIAIRKIGTGLSPLKPELVSLMVTHAANLTELQLRLYAPKLIHSL